MTGRHGDFLCCRIAMHCQLVTVITLRPALADGARSPVFELWRARGGLPAEYVFCSLRVTGIPIVYDSNAEIICASCSDVACGSCAKEQATGEECHL